MTTVLFAFSRVHHAWCQKCDIKETLHQKQSSVVTCKLHCRLAFYAWCTWSGAHFFMQGAKCSYYAKKILGAPYKFYIYKQMCLSVTFPNIPPHMLSSSLFFGAHMVKFVHIVEIWAFLGDNRCSLSLPSTWKFYLSDISLQWKLPTHAVVFVLRQLIC